MNSMKHARRGATLGKVTAVLGALALPPAAAEDIDLFIGASANAQNPNVLLIIDNSANWNSAAQHWPNGLKQGESELRALKTIAGELTDKINLGVMFFTPGANANNPNGPGGYVRYHVRQMTAANKAGLQELIGPDAGCADGNNSVNGTPNCIYKNFGTGEQVGTAKTDYSAAMFEAFKYFGGYTSPANAHNDVAGSPVDSSHFGALRFGGAPEPKSDASAYSGGASKPDYVTPISNANSCAKNYIIFIGNGFPVQDSPSALLSGVGGPTGQLPVPLFTSVSNTTTTNVGTGCGAAAASSCVGNITQAFKDANPADSYACVNSVNTACTAGSATGSATGSRTWTVTATKTVFTVTPTGTYGTPSTPNNADEWAKFLYNTDVNAVTGQQNVATYAIDVYRDQQSADQTGLLMSMAKYGGGEYYQASNEDDIKAALRKILISIQAVNSTFASASLPISATNRSQNENRVYIGMFRPDPDAKPRWYGNLKAYQIGLFNGVAELADAGGSKAVSSSTGFLASCARSFWTVDSNKYWSFSPDSAGHCTTSGTDIFSDSPDGPQVEKGGAAEMLRKNNDTYPYYPWWDMRKMYTCNSVSDCSSNSAWGPVLPPAWAIYWLSGDGDWQTSYHALGVDMNDENGNPYGAPDINYSDPLWWIRDVNETRPSIHGDVIHSRALPVNYGGSTGTVLYYGSNDGAFHAVDGNTGKELWSFIAPEHWTKLARLRLNSPQVLYPSMTAPFPVPAPTRKDYFFDGTSGLYQNADNSKVWIYTTMRRGGRMIYAFDVTNPSGPPQIMWRAGCPNATDDVGCTAGFSQIGQTWSTPAVALVKGYNSGTTPIVVVGGGYDECEDNDNSSPVCGSTKGNRVYVLDAQTGSILATFNTARAVAADVSLVDRNYDGLVDNAYVADTGGNLYRVDFAKVGLETLTESEWTMTKIAQTSGAGRKFHYGPGVLPLSTRVYLTITTGDRERPLISNYPYTAPVVNRAYMLIDSFQTTGLPVNLDDSTVMSDFNSGTSCSDSIASGKNGWFFDLNAGQGEQGVTSTLILGGVVYFSTNRPVAAVNSCSNNLGEARGYAVNLLNGSGAVGTPVASCGLARSGVFVGGGLPPSPVAGVVMVDNKKVTVCIGCIDRATGSGCQICAQKPPITISQKRTRQYWYRKGEK